MTRDMWLIWLLRADIRGEADWSDAAAQRDFVVWWVLWGRSEYPAVWQVGAAQRRVAMEPVPVAGGACPRLLLRLHAVREDLRQAFDLASAEAVAEFFCWYRISGPAELPCVLPLPQNCLEQTEQPSTRFPWAEAGTQVPRMAVAYWQRNPAIAGNDDPNDPRVRRTLAEWYAAQPALPAPRPLPQSGDIPVRQPVALRPNGVNLIVFVGGQSGVGEDVRMAAAALDAAKVPFVLLDVPAGPATASNDNSLLHRLHSGLRYDTSLYCMSAFDMAMLAVARGEKFFADQYRIGYWPWELPRFPDCWADALSLVDEIWTGSEFTAQAYRASGAKRVHCLPCPVELPSIQPTERSRLNLHRPDAFVFTYAFDPNSYMARKNPQALLRAFHAAFPPDRRDVALLLRVNGRMDGQPGWQDLRRIIAADDRITVQEGTLERVTALSMLAACDCLVSPHRAEGFGRNIAEAILLGLQVLATGYSGCNDFLAPESRVDYTLCPIRKGEYPFGDGLFWAEPSEEDLIQKMQAAPRRSPRRGKAADFRRRYSQAATGRAFAQRLEQIFSSNTADLNISAF